MPKKQEMHGNINKLRQKPFISLKSKKKKLALLKNQEILKTQYHKLLASPWLLTPCRQRTIGDGWCYGYSLTMADSDLSPYKNPAIKKIAFNARIKNFQNNQGSRTLDQQSIKRARLTRKYFCPSLDKQAKHLYKAAYKNRGQDLLVTLYGNRKFIHGCYLSCQLDGKIRYMDPNCGAFLFDNENQFIASYRLIYMYQHHCLKTPLFQFFDMARLSEDRQLEQKESKTFSGKLRTFLTGSKYPNEDDRPNMFSLGFSVFVGYGIGFAIGAVVGSFIPVIGTLFGGAVGGLITVIPTFLLFCLAYENNCIGVLGGIHYLQGILQKFGESVSSRFGRKMSNSVIPELDIPENKNTQNGRLANPYELMPPVSKCTERMTVEEKQYGSERPYNNCQNDNRDDDSEGLDKVTPLISISSGRWSVP